LEDAGAECIVIPCNTAQYAFDDLQTVAKARMISILDATLGDIPPSARHGGLLATHATLATGLYQKKALARGLTLIQP
ncbi:aspartate/glutamate racemase family protein, partial [Salmonella enterica subsp. enterica serovar Infantis]